MPVTDQEKAAKVRDAALQGALSQIEREFGKGTVMRMGDEGAQVRVNAIPTGALSLDIALGIGGVPRCFSSRRRHPRWTGDWSSDVCSSDLIADHDVLRTETVFLATGKHDLREWRRSRSEERRVGKECRSRWAPYH